MILDILIIVFLIGLAITLILLEIFLLPGITVAGIGGVIFAIGGIAYAYAQVGTLTGNITLAISLVTFGSAFIWFIRSKALDKLALKTDIEGNVSSGTVLNIHIGDEGITLSRLNPVGKIKVNGSVMEGRSPDEFIPEETPIVITEINSTYVTVQLKQK